MSFLTDEQLLYDMRCSWNPDNILEGPCVVVDCGRHLSPRHHNYVLGGVSLAVYQSLEAGRTSFAAQGACEKKREDLYSRFKALAEAKHSKKEVQDE